MDKFKSILKCIFLGKVVENKPFEVEKHFNQPSPNQKRVLIVFHMNFLRKDRGCSNYVFEIAQILKSLGYSIDFFSADPFFSSGEHGDIELLNDKLHLIDNFYASNWSQGYRKTRFLRMFHKDIFYKISYFNKDRYYFFNKCILSIHKKVQRVDVSNLTWVNEYTKEYFNKILEQNNYDFINIHYIQWADLITEKTPKNIKKIYTCQDTNFFQVFYNTKSSNKPLVLSEAFEYEFKSMNKFDKIMCISNDEKSFWEKLLPEKKFYFCPHPLEAQSIPENREITNDILFLGAANPYNANGLVWFVEKVYPKLNSDVKITVCGKVLWQLQQERPDFICKIKNLGFNLIDYAENLNELYYQTKLVINPLFEGTGMKIKTIEAMSYNVPIVSTLEGVNGFPDKNNNGLLVTNNPDEYAEFINQLLYNNEFYNQMKLKEKEYFEKYLSKDKVTKLIQELFS